MSPPILRALGLMSGTSMDGVDAALVETDGVSIRRFGRTFFRPYAPEDRDTIREAMRAACGVTGRGDRPEALARAEAVVTEAHADAVGKLLADAALEPDAVDVVGFHGQTVLHAPERGLTLQLGDGRRLADLTGIPVVFDFRAADVAAGGQGAPLVPVFHAALAAYSGLPSPLAILNLGGVANVTWIGAGGELRAFDTGPGNALLDDLVRSRTGAPFDEDGRLAAAGRVDENALALLLDDPYFGRSPPKSLDRDRFALQAVAGLTTADAAATLVAFTAEAAAAALRHLPEPPRHWIATGGGARNPSMLQALGIALARTGAPARIETGNAVGWASDFVEAQAFAYLAVRSLAGLPLSFPATTGVARAMTGGVIARPRHRPEPNEPERRSHKA